MWLNSVALLCLLLSQVCKCQDCQMSGEYCNDDKNCCGGCCINQICVDTYHDCRVKEDPCMELSCPADMTCEIYQPVDCPGCDIVKQCIFIDSIPLKMTSHPHPIVSGGKSGKKISTFIVYCMIFYFIYLLAI